MLVSTTYDIASRDLTNNSVSHGHIPLMGYQGARKRSQDLFSVALMLDAYDVWEATRSVPR